MAAKIELLNTRSHGFPMIVHQHARSAWAGTLLFVFAVGCGGDEQPITAYFVPKPEFVYEQNHAPPPDRTLGGIILRQQTGWFFKLTGPNEPVNNQLKAFRGLIESVRFSEIPDAPPAWTTPVGWDQQPGSGIRFATLVICPENPRLEVSVTPLAITIQDHDRYVLENINRWRNELGLKPTSLAQLPSHATFIDLGDVTAYLMNDAGHRGAGSMPGNSRAPFASAASPTRPQAVPSESLVDYDVPSSWFPAERVVSRGGISIQFEAAFEVVSEAERLDITISKFPATMARPLLNVNRWRQQLGLPDINELELNDAFETISVGGATAQRIELHSVTDSARPEMILAVLVEQAGSVYFIKLKGDQSLAERERSHFDEFAQSVRFSPEVR